MPKKHYLKNTKIYSVWNQMRNRCQNPNDKSYGRYGGKGISVCLEWQDFRNFYPWAMSNGYADGLTLDRIDPHGNYEPSNCRWISMLEQQRNRGNNVKLEKDGVYLTIKEWCEKLDVPYSCAKSRYYRKLKRTGSASFDDVFSSEVNYRIKAIEQCDMDGNVIYKWDKLSDIDDAGFSKRNVWACCHGRIKSAYGYIWRYAE